jgi:hypothetical protein
VADGFSERYGDLLFGSYDLCGSHRAQRLQHAVLRAGWVPAWWRRPYEGCEDQLDNTHLMRMAGWFARRVRASARAHGIPLRGPLHCLNTLRRVVTDLSLLSGLNLQPVHGRISSELGQNELSHLVYVGVDGLIDHSIGSPIGLDQYPHDQ